MMRRSWWNQKTLFVSVPLAKTWPVARILEAATHQQASDVRREPLDVLQADTG